MKLLVLGATGGTGLEIVSQAMERGHEITAFVRAPERLKKFEDRISIVQGDVLSSSELQRVIEGHDGILSGFGPRVPLSKADHGLLGRFAIALTNAMERTRVKRVVVLSVAFLFKDSILPPAYVLGRLFFSVTVADAAAMEETLRQSRLDWTIVRPPRLTDAARSGEYRVREDHLPRFGLKISRADGADFRAAEDSRSIGKIIGVAN
jgi:putative NADH-flavin reductase